MSIVIIDHRAKLPWLFQDFAFPHIVSVVVPSSAVVFHIKWFCRTFRDAGVDAILWPRCNELRGALTTAWPGVLAGLADGDPCQVGHSTAAARRRGSKLCSGQQYQLA